MGSRTSVKISNIVRIAITFAIVETKCLNTLPHETPINLQKITIFINFPIKPCTQYKKYFHNFSIFPININTLLILLIIIKYMKTHKTHEIHELTVQRNIFFSHKLVPAKTFQA